MWDRKGPMPFVILASGEGTNARALLEFAKANPGLVEAKALISDRPGIGALRFAEEYGVPAKVLSPKDEAFLEAVKETGAHWALLAGYKRLVSEKFLSLFATRQAGVFRVMNVHPSLLPAYPGLGGYSRAYADGVGESGVTVHLVDSGLDTGRVILQKSFRRDKADSLEAFEAKGRKLEWELFPQALRMAAEGKVLEER
jgi:phosphoribosylglycinamide formyltransferase-1